MRLVARFEVPLGGGFVSVLVLIGIGINHATTVDVEPLTQGSETLGWENTIRGPRVWENCGDLTPQTMRLTQDPCGLDDNITPEKPRKRPYRTGTFDAVKFYASRLCGYVFSSGLNPLVLKARSRFTQGSPLLHFAPRLLLPDAAPLSTFGITLATSRLPNNLQQIGQHNAEKPLTELKKKSFEMADTAFAQEFFFHLSYVTHAAADIA
ncbi:hypothetical protein F4604DRAFT_1680717 [Suillus subluteus]|nr:hypothetical protein F4604DRAFT_1680717 [Suillus subluteus]